MFKKSFFHELKNRNLITQITNYNKIKDILKKEKITLYCGFDPTADSLHVGHILPLLYLKRFQLEGHTPIVIIGGATSLIGDPSFRSEERKLLNLSNNNFTWIKNIKSQIYKFLDFSNISNKAIILNNYHWFKEINILSFLRNVGKHFSITQMINKESVKQRIMRVDQGISFTEFSYSLLQAYDFYFLYKKYNACLQIGGSDQWGNIISGINLIHSLNKSEAFGITFPLLIKSDGIKFGKSGTKTIWLDPKKTTPYEFYQFWINISDQELYNYLKYFTFLDLKEIDKIKCLKNNKVKFIKFKKKLAKDMTILIHGQDKYLFVKRISTLFFSHTLDVLTEEKLNQFKDYGAPHIIIKNSLYSIQEILVLSNLASSNRQARNLISSNSISINYKKINILNYFLLDSDKLFNKYTIITKGKKNFCLIIWI
ncbi:tyrosine--tRNA ligase [Buchnera aphidicola]|uniref:tyrosine--tRNA ligase n=1 Tax=Buchnera aphidicola TaxID=9 RepID=UPI002237000A|nr:tyrosine--tRNA ligase [Buchnera aphidicola]MCW5197623.1 tyrosine--tRNA ligase [Buchnera aphidicola (Chaitophorus viminalis)]